MNKVFDAHFHIIDDRFPLTPNQGYLPNTFTASDYLKEAAPLQIKGGAIVSGSFQAFDQTYLLAALKELGPSYVGVAQLPATVSDEEILSLNAAGVRAVRFNCKRGGSETIDQIETFGKRVYDLVNWHVELYIDSKELSRLTETILKLPAVSIDHLGLSKEGFKALLSLVEKGVKVKATGFGRVNFDIPEALKAIMAANPDALMFGTDLPSTRAPRPFYVEDLKCILELFDQAMAHKILYQNAIDFYHPSSLFGSPTNRKG